MGVGARGLLVVEFVEGWRTCGGAWGEEMA